jgi:hypothetical protein
MKSKILYLFLSVFIALFALSCEALPVDYSANQSWTIADNTGEKNMITLNIQDVEVDRTGSWDSVTKEVNCLAPLYFWDNGLKVVSAGESPAYKAVIQLSERELYIGWRTKKSLSVNVLIWALDGGDKNILPVSVGRSVFTGEKSFSSSATVNRMLKSAINSASKELAKYEKGKDE